MDQSVTEIPGMDRHGGYGDCIQDGEITFIERRGRNLHKHQWFHSEITHLIRNYHVLSIYTPHTRVHTSRQNYCPSNKTNYIHEAETEKAIYFRYALIFV